MGAGKIKPDGSLTTAGKVPQNVRFARRGARVTMRYAVPIVCVVLLLGCSGLMPPARTTAAKPATGDPLHDKVLEALKKCVDDPEGLEVISWGTLTADPDNRGHTHSIRLRFRAKNKVGGRQVYDWDALLKGDKVHEFLDAYEPPAGRFHTVPN